MDISKYAEATATLAAQQFRKVILAERKVERETRKLDSVLAKVPDSGLNTYMEMTEEIRQTFEQ